MIDYMTEIPYLSTSDRDALVEIHELGRTGDYEALMRLMGYGYIDTLTPFGELVYETLAPAGLERYHEIKMGRR